MIQKVVVLFAAICLLSIFNLNAQITCGLQVQNFGRNGGGGGQIDSITAITNSNAQLLEYMPQGVGFFFEYQLKSRFPLTIRSELNYRGGRPSGLQLFVFNNVTGRISQSSYSEVRQSYSFEVPINLNYAVFKKGLRLLNNSVEFEAGLLAGISFQFQSKADDVAYQKQPSNSSGVVDVNSAISNSTRTTNYFYNYGLRLRLWNFILIYRIDQLINNSAVNNLAIWGNNYPFKVTYEYQSISLGYRINVNRK